MIREMHAGPRLIRDELTQRGCQWRVTQEVSPDRMDGKGSGRMTLVATDGFKFDARILNFCEVVQRRVEGQILDDGEIAPFLFPGSSLHQQEDPNGGIGECSDVIEHRAAIDILLGADQADVRDWNRLAIIEQLLDQSHVVDDLRFSQSVSPSPDVGWQGSDRVGPGLVNPVGADRGANGFKIRATEPGEIEGWLQQESRLSGNGGGDQWRGVGGY